MYIHTNTSTYIHTHEHTYTHINIHTQTTTYIHTHQHTHRIINRILHSFKSIFIRQQSMISFSQYSSSYMNKHTSTLINHIYMHAFTYLYQNTHINIQRTCIPEHKYINIHVLTPRHPHIYINNIHTSSTYINIHTCITTQYTYTHINVHTHTYI